MENAYAEKAQRKLQEKEEERLQKEKERKYYEDVAKREAEHQQKKAAIQFEKDKRFEKICLESNGQIGTIHIDDFPEFIEELRCLLKSYN